MSTTRRRRWWCVRAWPSRVPLDPSHSGARKLATCLSACDVQRRSCLLSPSFALVSRLRPHKTCTISSTPQARVSPHVNCSFWSPSPHLVMATCRPVSSRRCSPSSASSSCWPAARASSRSLRCSVVRYAFMPCRCPLSHCLRRSHSKVATRSKPRVL